MNSFERALAEVLKDEGGYVNHPKDPGGATNKGVTQRVYDDYRQRNGQPAQSVKQITAAEVTAIYRASYWSLAKCDNLPAGIDYVVFDGAVNSGVSQSIKWLQRAVSVRDDGQIGPTTITAVLAYPDHDDLVDKICNLRLNMLRHLDGWSTFRKGWSVRVARVRKIGQAWATGAATPQIAAAGNLPMAKAYASDAAMPVSPAVGDTATGAGGAGLVLTQTINTLTPLSQVEIVAKMIMWLTAASAVLAIGGIAWGIYARHRKAAVKDAVQAGT